MRSRRGMPSTHFLIKEENHNNINKITFSKKMIKNIDIHNVYYDLPYNTSNSKGIFIPKDHHYNANNKRKKGKKKCKK